MPDDQLRAPRGLGPAGRRLWSAVAGQAAELGCRLDAIEIEQLASACRLKDWIADLEGRLDGADLVLSGSRLQPICHPLLVELRLTRELLSRTLARLSFPAEESGGLQIMPRSTHARSAANRRWRGGAA